MRNKIIFGLILLVNFLGYSQDIDLTLKYNTTLNRYEVYARPDFTQNNFTWGPSQISVVVPAAVANTPLQNLTSFNAGNWGDNSIIYAPTPQPQSDFHGVDSGGALTNLIAGQELLIFSFTVDTGCVPGLRLFNIGLDPDSSQPGMFGGDFSNSIDNGMLTDVYNVNYNNSGTICIDAVDDNMSINFPNGGIIGNVFADNGFGQDTLYGTPITVPSLVAISLLDNDGITGLIISPSGDVIIPANTAPGTYQVIYQICETAISTNCDSATIFITVNGQIIAEDDTISANEINGTIGNIFPNNGVAPDTLNGNPITIGSTVSITLISNGGLTGLAIDTNGTITIPINSNVNNGIPYIAEYQICDALNPAVCDTAFITITLVPSIIAQDDNNFTISTSQQGIVGNIFDDNGNGIDSLETIAITNPSLVTISIFGVSPLPGLVISPNGDIFVPLNTVPQSYSIEYQICEVANPSNCDTATFTIYVIAAEDDSATVDENDSVNIDIFFNDTLFVGDPNVPQYGTLTVSTLPTNGTVTITDPNNTPLDPTDDVVTYTPTIGYSGPDSFVYTICNTNSPIINCDSALVTINVAAASANIVTVKTDNSATYTPGTNVTYTITVTNNGPDDAVNVIVNDPLPTGIITATWSGTNGSSGVGVLSNTIPTLVNGASVVYTLTLSVPSNYTGNLTNIVTVTTDTSDPDPTCTTCTDIDTPLLLIDAVDDTLGPILNNIPQTINIFNNDTLNGSPFIPSVVTVTINPSVFIPGSTFDPTTGILTIPTGTTSGTYIIPYTICEVANPTNCDNAFVTVFITNASANIVTVKTDNSATYTPGTNVTYTITVTNNGPDDAVNVIVNDPLPTGIITATWSGTNGSSGVGVLSNTIPTLVNGASVVYTLTLTVPSNYTGNLTNIVTVTTDTSDPDPTCTTCTDIDTPLLIIDAVDDTLGPILNNIPQTINIFNNDTLNGSPFIPSVVTVTINPSVVIPGSTFDSTTGILTIPAGTTSGTYIIPYTICEVANPTNCDNAFVTITVTNPPVVNTTNAIADINVTYVDTPVSGNVLINDYDVEGDTQTVTTTTLTNVGEGTLIFNTNGTYTFTPVAGYVGTTTFTYTVCDNITPPACDTATLTIEVLPVVDGDNTVTAIDDTATTEATNPIIIVVLANDFDMEGDAFTITSGSVSNPTNGTAILNPNGTITYTANVGYVGQDTFTYTICDNVTPTAACDTATVTVYVNRTNTTNNLVANDDSYNTNIDVVINGNVLTNDTDPEGDVFTVTTNTNPTNGTVVVNSNGTFTYTPTAGYFGPDSFTYTICDNGTPQACDTATVYISVNPDTNPPVVILLVDDSVDISMNEEIIINIYDNDIGIPDCGVLTIITQPAHGTLVINQNGTPIDPSDDIVTYISNQDYYGSDEFTYQITDCDGISSNIAIVTINIGVVFPACEIQVFNAISPNTDEINDILIIQGLACHPQNSIEIYNRWGILVYETENYATVNNYFRGISEGRSTVSSGEELPDGTYFYILKYVDTQDNNSNKQKTGYLYLSR